MKHADEMQSGAVSVCKSCLSACYAIKDRITDALTWLILP